VEEWEDRDVDEIWNDYGIPDDPETEQPDHLSCSIWDSPDIFARQRFMTDLELQNFPLLDETGHEIPIYTESGYRILRRDPLLDLDARRLAPLMKLRHIEQLFQEPEEISQFSTPSSPISFDVYPLLGLQNAGHCQANNIPGPFLPKIEKLNNIIISEKEEETMNIEDFDWEDDEHGNDHSPHQPVLGIAFQAYNTLSHYTRGNSATHHEVQCGIVTGELTGTWATGNNTIKAAKFKAQCRSSLPHDRFEAKLHNPNLQTDLRLENVYVIDVRTLPCRWKSAT